MPTILKVIITVIVFLIIGLVAYILYLYKQEKAQNLPVEEKQEKPKQEKPKQEKVKKEKPTYAEKAVTKALKKQKEEEVEVVQEPLIAIPVLDWQKDLLIKITKERLLRIQNSDKIKKLDADELEVLSKIIEKKNELVDWSTLVNLTRNQKTYGILNIAILDHLYINLPKKTMAEETIQTAYLLDTINGGIENGEGEVNYLPFNLDVNATLIKILNNDMEIENRKNRLTIQTVKRACLEFVSNGGYKDLNWPAKQVICRIILDNLAKSVYNYNNTENMLSDENKIYLRLLSITLYNDNYSEIVESLSKM